MNLRTDMKRAFFSGGFLVPALVMAITVIIGVMGTITNLNVDDPDLFIGACEKSILSTLSSDMILLLSPILCAIPFSAAFLDDYKSKYIKLYLPRCGKHGYIFSKIITTGLTGGAALFVGIIIAYALLALILTPVVIPSSVKEILPPAPSAFSDIILRAGLYFISGTSWALFGQLLATATMSRYIAYASPFIGYYVLVMLCERYMGDVLILNPKTWLGANRLDGIWEALALLLVLTSIISVAFYLLAKRRLSDA